MLTPHTRLLPGLLTVVLVLLFLALGWTAWRSLDAARASLGLSVRQSQDRLDLLVSRLQAENKWVVATQTLTAQVDRGNDWYVLGWVYLGRTQVHLRVDQCRVQYYIPGPQVRLADLRLRPPQGGSPGHLAATLPRPVLDEAFLDIPSDPACWSVQKSSGWARFDKHAMERQARADLRARILKSVRRQGWDPATDVVAKATVADLLRRLLGQSDLTVEVQWR